MSSEGDAAEVVAALAAAGFEPKGSSDDGWLRLQGPLRTSLEVHDCELQLDRNFIELPRIHLLRAPPNLSKVTPHLAGGVHLCYIARGSVVLDIFDPVGQTLACLKRAEQVLDQVLRGEMVEDLEEEFYIHWGGPYCLVDIQGARLGRLDCLLIEPGGQGMAVVTDGPERTNLKLKALGWEIVDGTILTYRVRTSAKPRPHTTSWPPRTVKDILSWQALLDQRCRRKIEKRLSEALKTDAKGALILVESPLLTYGFAVMFERPVLRRNQRRAPAVSLYQQEVTPLSVVRIDDEHIATRNIPGMQTLAGKRVALIGCGTIGGYLADMLVKAGAGTAGGELTLVDFESLGPQNLGRHRLGFPSLFSNKAKALAEELARDTPGAAVRPLPVDVRLAHLGALDLLIDATGEEALGHWLCKRYLPCSPMLTAWIEGPGTAVRALLRADEGGACYRCLCDANKGGRYPAVVGSMPKVFAGQGCEGLYVPFPAHVSVQAAALASEVALAWANKVDAPSLRTRVVDASFQSGTADCSPTRTQGCPACSS